jgi:DNA-binding HxlR family transcriptional regulator
MSRRYNQLCPIASTLDIIGDRWTMLILRDLFLGASRFNQFLQNSPGLPSKLLSDRLKKLEAHALIERAVYSQHPLRAEYRLTAEGASLQPVLYTIAVWGLDHVFEGDEATRAAVLAHITAGLSTPAA